VAVAPNGQHLYVADYDSVSVINTSTRQVVADVVIPDLCAGMCYGSSVGLNDLAISPNGERVYVIQAYATDIGPWGSVAVIQTSDNSLIYNEFSAYVTDLEYTSDGSRLFYTQGDYRFVHVSDFSLGQTPVIELSTPDSGWAVPLAIAVRPDGLRAYVVVDSEMFDSLGAKYVAVIDTDRSSPTYNTVIGHFSAPYGAQEVAVSADGRRLYISLADGKTVEVIDTSTNAVLGYFTKPGAGAMAVGPDGTLYFTDPATGRMHAVTTGAPPVV
jgi:YVTN family beta-propeller protein